MTDADDGPLSSTVLTRLARPVADRETRVAVFADTHVDAATTTHLRRAVADVERRSVDAVIHAGDLSRDGRRKEFDLFDDLCSDLTAPLFAVPGNHDLPKSFDGHEGLPFDEFRSRYAPDGFPTVDRVGGVDLVRVNSAGTDARLVDTHDGAVPAADVERLDALLADAATPVVVVHHNLPAMLAQYESYRDAILPDHDGTPPVLRRPEPLVDALVDRDVPLVLTGHMHVPAVAAVDGVREVQTPSMQTFPMAYSLVEVGPEGTTVRLATVADHDELRDAHRTRFHSKPNSQVLTSMAAVRLAEAPLADER